MVRMQESELEKLAMEAEAKLGFKPEIEATIGNYPLLKKFADPKHSMKQSSFILDGIDEVIKSKLGLGLSPYQTFLYLQMPGNEAKYIEALRIYTQLSRKYAVSGCRFFSDNWLIEAISDGRQDGLSSVEAKRLAKRPNFHLICGDDNLSLCSQEYIQELGVDVPTNEDIIASRKKIIESVDPEIVKDLGYLNMLALQSNMRGPYISSFPEQLKNAVSNFTTSKHGLEDNLALGLAMGYNGDNLFGTTNLLFIPEFQAAFPHEVGKIAKIYLDKLEQAREFFTRRGPNEHYDDRVARLNALLRQLKW